MYDKLISQFLTDLGFFNPVIGIETQIKEFVVNYRAWPTVNAILSRVHGVMARGPGVNCVVIPSIPAITISILNGETKLVFRNKQDWNRVFAEMQTHKQNNIRWVYIVFGLSWKETNTDTSSSHLSMFVVDNVNQTYSYFDPEEGGIRILDDLQPNKQRKINLYDIFCCNDCRHVIPDYECVDQRQSGRSLQSVLDTTDGQVKCENPETVIPDGLCAFITLLVLVCCLRFQSGDPWPIARSIKIAFCKLSRPNKEEFRTNFTMWVVNIYKAGNWKSIARILGLCNHPNARERICGVLDATSEPCPYHPVRTGYSLLCEEHYYKLLLQSFSDKDQFVCYFSHNVVDINGQFPVCV